MSHYHEVLRELREPTRELRQTIPHAWAGFAALHESAMADGVLPTRLKEAIALALAVVKHCDGCIAYHAKAAARAGATRQEIAEVLAVAMLMEGGPATVYAPRAFEAFDEFAAAAEPVAATSA